MDKRLYFQFDDDNKAKYIYYVNHHKGMEMDKLYTQSPTYCIMDSWENMHNPTHTLDKLYLTGIL